MKEIRNSGYSSLFFIGLACFLLCAWFSLGFYQVDEHFQVLEFANYKMGHSPAYLLPWEFGSKVRATLMPDLVYLLGKLLEHFGLYNPFIIVFLFRLCSGITAWYIICRLCLLLLDTMKTETGKRLFICLCLFMWFVPSVSVRFSSENVAGIAFLYGVYFILKSFKENRSQFLAFAIAGFLFGMSGFIRIQILSALAGFVAWLLFIKKGQWKNLTILSLSFGIGVLFNYLLDWWFYGSREFTPLNYFYSNIILHKAAGFGVSPWWFYFREFYDKGYPPLSLILLIAFAVGAIKNPKNPMVWSIVPFLVLHCAIGHKELRFLFTIIYPFLYLSALGFDYLLTTRIYPKIHKYVFLISAIITIPLLAHSIFFAEDQSAAYCRFLYYNIKPNNNTLFALNKDRDWGLLGTTSTFYRNPLMKDVFIDTPEQIADSMLVHHMDSAYFLDKRSKEPLVVSGFKTERAYSFYPTWISIFNINHWEERTGIWTIYQVSKPIISNTKM